MLGEALRIIRVFHDLKTSELAKRLDLSPSYISEIENGKKTPSLEIIQKYAKEFRTTTSSILFFSESIEKDSKKSGKSALKSKLIKFLQLIENVT